MVIDDYIIKSLWGSVLCGYSTLVEVWCTSSFKQVLVVKGRVLLTGQ